MSKRFLKAIPRSILIASLLLCLLGITLGAAACPSKGPAVRGVTDTEIKIGMLLALTGPFPTEGLGIQNAEDLAVEQINQAGGINGRKIKMVYIDTSNDPQKEIAGVKRLVEVDQAFATGAVLFNYPQVSDYVEEEKVPMINFYNPQDDIVRNPNRNYCFQIAMTQYPQIQPIINEMVSMYQPKTIGIFMDTVMGGETFINDFKALLEASHPEVEIVAEEYCDFGALDVSSQWLRIKAANPDAILCMESGPLLGNTVKVAREIGVTAPMFGGHIMGAEGAATVAGSALEGVYFVNYLADSPHAPTKPEMKNFHDAFFAAYPDANRDAGMNIYTGYAFIKLIEEALNRAGPNFDVESFIDACETLSDFDPGTVLPVAWSPEYHTGADTYNLFGWDAQGIIRLISGPKPTGALKY
jgi:branched-chain amino acid transport system substrate-binding protein